jgi:glycopeptide antibiotics resistance protein
LTRRLHAISNDLKVPDSKQPRALLVTLFVLYLVLVTWIILWKLELPWVGDAALLPRPWKLIPFVPSGDANASNPMEVLANVGLFVPFGLYLGLLAPAWRWWKAVGVFVGASLALEITQHLISVGSFDSTDVIANAAGGLAGLGLLAVARRKLSKALLVRVLVVGAALSALAIALFIASPLHYAAQRDVVFPLPGSSERP